MSSRIASDVLSTGTILAGYRIERLIGRGAVSDVYEATQRSRNRTVALKLVIPELSDDPEFREQLRRARTLIHPHIVPTLEVRETEQGLLIAMRLMRGGNLGQIAAGGALDPERALRLLGQIAGALDSAHAAGIVHGHVKPENILVDKRGHPYLGDFGLVTAPGELSPVTTGEYGSLHYVAPEQIRGERPGPRSDVYALGAVLYECLTGAVPYPREFEAAVLHAHVREPPPRPSAAHPGLPGAIDGVIARAMAKEPELRHDSAAALISEAEKALARAEEGALLVSPEAREAVEGGPRRSRVLLALAIAGVVVLAAAAFGFLVGRSHRTSEPPPFRSTALGPVVLTLPHDWIAVGGRVVVPDLLPRQRFGVAPAGRIENGGLAGGLSAGDPPTYLPASFAKSARDVSLTHAALVRTGPLEGYRYSELEARGFSPRLTVYAFPTTLGVATLACFASTGPAPAIPEECERIVGTLRITRGRPLGVGASREFAATIAAAVRRLNVAREAGRGRLARATTPEAQVTTALATAGAFDKAASEVDGSPAAPDQRTRRGVEDVLRRTAAAYRGLAKAARRGSATGFEAARALVTRLEGQVNERLGRLRELGYAVQSFR